MATLYSVEEDDDNSLREKMRAATHSDGTKVYTLPAALSLMVFYVLAMQCMSTLAVVKRETKTWKWPIFQLVYKEASPNRYLASFAPILSKFRETDYAQVVLQKGFTEFFDFHVSCFENFQEYPIGFVGSIATTFKPELEKVAAEFECTLGKFVTKPIDEIADYFIAKTSN